MMKPARLSKSKQIKSAIVKHLVMKNYEVYDRILRHMAERGDIWMVSQGEYMLWWQKRQDANLKVTVSNGMYQASTDLENAVIEKFPGNFLNAPVAWKHKTDFSGEVWITVDSALPQKELALELLRREGILNFRIAGKGEFMLSRSEIGPLLEEIETKLCKRGVLFEEDIRALRQIVVDKLAAYRLPLLRLWYYPRVNGIVMRAVFSPRHDVDRAITNLARIRKLETRYGVSSTLYLRAFCPFYTDTEIKELAAQPWCSEISLHGEFVTNVREYGDEYKAALAEKVYLEKLIERPVLGVCMHGGELSSNRSKNTFAVLQDIGLLYDTTQSMEYYFPFRKMIDGQLSHFYALIHATGDIKMPATQNYGQVFYEQTVAKMNEIYEQNGVFVLMLHPVYFGFFRYLFHPRNWGLLLKFCRRYFALF